MKYTLDLPVDSPDKANAIEKTRQLTNAWVAKYRRDKAIIGRPSYDNAYSPLDAVSGHYNNFGTKYRCAAEAQRSRDGRVQNRRDRSPEAAKRTADARVMSTNVYLFVWHRTIESAHRWMRTETARADAPVATTEAREG